jgi:DNA-binding GntR family transcriptional regulator
VRGHYVVREALEVQAAMRFTQVATPGERAELKKLSLRVDALSMQSDRAIFLGVHQKLHARIAQCARCPALLDAIEKTHALASIWFCVMRQPQLNDSPTRHSELIDAVCSDDPLRAAEAVRQHIAVGMKRSLDVLQPYFKLRKATGRTFHRSDKRMKPLDLSQLH